MTIKKFRMIDIAIFSFIAIATDVAANLFGLLGIKFYLAISAVVITLIYIRWKTFGLLTNVLIIATHWLLFGIVGGDWLTATLHALSLVGLSIILVFVQLYKIKGRYGFLQIAGMFLAGYITTFLIEWGLYNLLEPTNFINLLLNHLITIVLGLGLCFIIIKQENLAIDMDYYLRHKDKGKTS